MALKSRLFSYFWLTSTLLFTPYGVQAMEIATSNLEFSNLQIQPTIGTVVLSGDWLLDSFSEARNSLGDVDQDFAFSPVGGIVSTAAAVAWAEGKGSAAAVNFPPDFNVTANASSNVELPGVEDGCNPKWASAQGRGTLFNEFTIIGGTGFVGVDFSALIQGGKNVKTDRCGTAETELISALEIFGVLPGDQDTKPLYHRDKLSIGPNDADSKTINELLFGTRILEFNVPYFFVIEVDSESRATVPEPPSLVLLFIGLSLWVGFTSYRHVAS